MKCPKCGYVSFDHHQVCPKCSKDILAEQRRLNLPDYRPEPPFFLGALTGEVGPGLSAFSQEADATVEFNGSVQSNVRDDGLSPLSEVSAPSAASAISSVPDKAPDDELELDLDELSLDLDESSGSEEPSLFQFEPRSAKEDAISLESAGRNDKRGKLSNDGSAQSDRPRLAETLATGEGEGFGEHKMRFDTAEMLTLEMDRKIDATSSELVEDELDEFEFDIDLDELKEVKD